MGMAASQARYLALVARKSNCEYEGQQINQARTVLSNQSANLFNQMLGLNVPVPPSTQDFTVAQYSYKDGANSSTISNWQQLSEADPDYNYVVTHYYYTDKYTGSQKKLTDPQVQFSTGGTPADGAQIKAALDEMSKKLTAYNEAKAKRMEKESEAASLDRYKDTSKYQGITNCAYSPADDKYTITKADGDFDFVGYDKLYDVDTDGTTLIPSATQQEIDELVQRLVDEGALDKKFLTNKSGIYYCNGDIAFSDDIAKLTGGSLGGTGTILPTYNIADTNTIIDNYETEIADLKAAEQAALNDYNVSVAAYESLSRPTYIGNCELTPLAELTKDQLAEINQIIADMQEQGINDNISKCFDGAGNYTGGIYSFQLNGVTYYTTYDDLENSYASGTGNNHIDGQAKLAYYNATYVKTKVEKTEKALLETDGNGRFTSVRFEDDSVTYTLNMETVTDEAAYQDAMNQYYYDNAVYDKMVQDINAKTSLIQQEDLQLELRLKQLDTEQSALSTEMEAVKKVVDDNVESSFKTFNG